MTTSNHARSSGQLNKHIKLIRIDESPLPQFNLCLIDDTTRKGNKLMLDPLAWLESDEAQQLLQQATKSDTSYYHVYTDRVMNVYVHDFWIYLAYLQHCIGNNLDNAIIKAMGV